MQRSHGRKILQSQPTPENSRPSSNSGKAPGDGKCWVKSVTLWLLSIQDVWISGEISLFQSSVEDLLVVSTAQQNIGLQYINWIMFQLTLWTKSTLGPVRDNLQKAEPRFGRIPDWRWCIFATHIQLFLDAPETTAATEHFQHQPFDLNNKTLITDLFRATATEKGPGTTPLLAANTTRRAFQVALLAWARLVVLEAYAPRAVPYVRWGLCGEDGSNTLEMMTYKTSSVKRTLMLIKHLVYLFWNTHQAVARKTSKGMIL